MLFIGRADKRHHMSCVSLLCTFWIGLVSNALPQLPLPLTRLRDAARWTDRQAGRGEAGEDRKSFRMLRKEAEDKTAP